MSVSTNTKLYEEVKQGIYAKYPKHSAYRSELLVHEYKNVVELIVEISQRGVWAGGLKRSGKTKGENPVIKRKAMCIGLQSV